MPGIVELTAHGKVVAKIKGNTREKKMAAERSCDAIVIGAGQGGKPLSMVLAKAGLKTAVVEERYVGGTCVNYG